MLRSDKEKQLQYIARKINIPISLFEDAERRYKKVHNCFHDEKSLIKDININVYLQGSFNLGTTIKPLNPAEEYDIDTICEFSDSRKTERSQSELKELIGNEIKRYAGENGINVNPIDKNRSWRLKYADQFHIDIVPAVPDYSNYSTRLNDKKIAFESNKYVKSILAITDRRTSPGYYSSYFTDWEISNPRGYAQWFKERMNRETRILKEFFAMESRINVDDIPDYKIKTTLQKSVQILKAHRDVFFGSKATKKDKPSSVIITTLSALIYRDEERILDSLKSIINNLKLEVSINDIGEYEITNPTAPDENFANKWNEDLELKSNFDRWVEKLKKDFKEFLESDLQNEENFFYKYSKNIGSDDIEKSEFSVSLESIQNKSIETYNKFVDNEQFIENLYPIRINKKYNVNLECLITQNGFQPELLTEVLKKKMRLKPRKELKFRLESTNVPEPYHIEWKVKNIGGEAEKKNCLRGEIIRGTRIKVENTLFKGEHFVECYIIKNDECVAWSRIDVPIED